MRETDSPAVEILAPVGNQAMLEAALAAGADAVYLAAEQFGARAYAENFNEVSLAQTLDAAHRQGVKVYVTVNTLIKEEELHEVLSMVARLYEQGADALIVQDPGLLSLLHRQWPDLPLHGSTQLSVTSLEGAVAAEALGLQRIVLGREVSLEEIRRIHAHTHLELEVFVHGSLCVSVSGQCTMSSFAGGRSGNRGRCAQPCRKVYALEQADGRPLGPPDTYLSPRDLCTLEAVPALVEAGCHSLKIEGRMKKPDYVFAAVLAYRQALHGQPADSVGLRLMTNRPFTKGFLMGDFGVDYGFSQRDLPGRAVGHVEKRGKQTVLVFEEAMETGDIVTVEGARGRFPLTLTRPFPAGASWDLAAYPDVVRGPAMQIYTPRPRRRLQAALTETEKKAPVDFSVTLVVGEPVRLRAEGKGRCVQVEGPRLEEAKKQPLTEETVRRALEKTGDTPFVLRHCDVQFQGAGFLRVAELNALRRRALEALLGKEAAAFHRVGTDWTAFSFASQKVRAPQRASLQIGLETEQAPAAFSSVISLIDRVYLRSHQVLSAWLESGKEVVLLPPRWAQHAEYEAFWTQVVPFVDALFGFGVQTLNDWGFWRTHLSGDRFLSAEAPMNLTNTASLRWALEAGFSQAVPSVELQAEALRALQGVDIVQEYPVYGRFAGMILRHCPVSLWKQCRSTARCEHCSLRRGVFLRDRFGKRELQRQGGYTEVLLPDLVDWRMAPEAVQRVQPQRIRVVDRGESELPEVLRGWREWEKTGRFPTVSETEPLTGRKRSPGRLRLSME